MPSTFKKVNSDNEQLNKMQENVSQALLPVLGSAILDGVLLTEIELTTGQANLIEHKLGRRPLGWIAVRKRAESTLWDNQNANLLNNRTLDLRCSSNVTVDLWIF